jgi:hypothetical protein
MTPGDKERAVSSIPNIDFNAATTAIIIPIKATTLEVFKSESFAGFRYKFKAFCTQIHLDV